jgi:O-antigen ligase
MRLPDDEQRRTIADSLVIALAVSLPWSTSATATLAVLWFVVLIATLDLADLKRELLTPAGGLPVALWALVVLGMLWSEASWPQRLAGINPYVKLLAIPLLLAQFRRSQNGYWVVAGFFTAAITLLIASWLMILFFPGVTWRHGAAPGVPVKDYFVQSGIFTLCIFALAWSVCDDWPPRKWRWWGSVLAAAFLANLLFVAASRTALVVLPALAALFALRRFGVKGLAASLVAGAIIGSVAWVSSPYLRDRISSISGGADLTDAARMSVAIRLEFWRKSISFVESAPLVGHGTGSVAKLFDQAIVGQTGVAAVPSSNPHNQTLLIGIQLGLLGIVVLYALWLAHLLLFRGAGFPNWMGLVLVAQNIASSAFNSHLSDFSEGWIYVVGVGVLGGMVLGGAPRQPAFPRLWQKQPHPTETNPTA